MDSISRPQRIQGLSAIAGDYRYVLCDAWGVVHNGVKAYSGAVEALRRCREMGYVTLIITNAPRPKESVIEQFERFGVDHGAFDDIVTSGEAASDHLAARLGTRILHIGTERDLPIYDGIDVRLVDEEDAELVSCTGLFDDENETPDDYVDRMSRWKERGLPMLCANPDKVVERGHKLIWCAGALAERYAAMGGETTIVGKPHRPIYETAMARFASITGKPVDTKRVLAIGDALETDLRGARDFGLDALFVTAGIHAEAYGERENPDPAKVGATLRDAGLTARAFIPHLDW